MSCITTSPQSNARSLGDLPQRLLKLISPIKDSLLEEKSRQRVFPPHFLPLRGCRPRFRREIHAARFVFAYKVHITDILVWTVVTKSMLKKLLAASVPIIVKRLSIGSQLVIIPTARLPPQKLSTSAHLIHINQLIHTHQLIHIKCRIHTLKNIHKALTINEFRLYLRLLIYCKPSLLP